MRSSSIFFSSALPMRLMKSLKLSPPAAFGDVAVGEAGDHLRNVFRRNRHDRQSVRTAVVLPFAAEDDLEVGHGVPGDLAADAVEAQVGDVVLAAAVEAAADFDVQILDCLVHLQTFFGQAGAQLAGQSARRRNPQLAGIGAGAGDDIDDGARARLAQADGVQMRCRVPARSRLLTQRITKFCSTVVRIVSLVKRRTMSASERS